MLIIKGEYASLHKIDNKYYLYLKEENKSCFLEIACNFDKEYLERKIIKNEEIDLYIFKRLKIVNNKTKELIKKENLMHGG